MQPPYQPSGNAPATARRSRVSPTRPMATTLPPQTQPAHRRPADTQGRELGVVRRLRGTRRWTDRGEDLAASTELGAELPVPPPAVQLLRRLRAGHAATARSTCSTAALDGAEFISDRRRHAAAGGVLQAAGQPEPARGLYAMSRRRRAHRRRGRAAADEPAVEEHGGRHHLRRERRLLGPRGAAEGRPLGPGHAHSGDRHLAVREEGRRRPHAVRHGLDPALHHAPLRPADAAGPGRTRCGARSPTAASRWAT